MKLKGWEVTRTNYYQVPEVYAWRHDAREGPSQTLRISREVLEGYPPFAVIEQLGRLRVADPMRAYPTDAGLLKRLVTWITSTCA